MIINKDYDYILVGENSFCYLLGVTLLDLGKKVLIVDDDKFKWGDNWGHYIGHLEKNYLELWGEHFNIPLLKYFDNYLNNYTASIIFDRKHLWLGNSPYENIKEICRKLTNIFDVNINDVNRDIFDKYIFKLSNKISEKIIKSKNLNYLDEDIFTDFFSSELKELFLSFYDKLKYSKQKKTYEYFEIKNFYYALKSFFHLRIDSFIDRCEFYHLFLSLLSPMYYINKEKVIKDFKSLFLHKKGQYKKTSISSFVNDGKDKVTVELSSFDGIVHTGKLIILGDTSRQDFLGLYKNPKHYYSWKSTIKLRKKFPSTELKNHHYLLYKSSMVGTDFPLIELAFQYDQILCGGAILKQNVDKLDFYRDEIESMLFSQIVELMPFVKKELSRDKFKWDYSHNKWIILDQKSVNNKFYKQNKKNKLFFSQHKTKNKYDNIRYIGPLQNYEHGFLSCLIDLKSLINEAR